MLGNLQTVLRNTSLLADRAPEYRAAQDAKRDLHLAVSPRAAPSFSCLDRPAVTVPLFAEHHSAHNDWTACRMRLHMASAGHGHVDPSPLRPYARTPRLPGSTRRGLRPSMADNGSLGDCCLEYVRGSESVTKPSRAKSNPHPTGPQLSASIVLMPVAPAFFLVVLKALIPQADDPALPISLWVDTDPHNHLTIV